MRERIFRRRPVSRYVLALLTLLSPSAGCRNVQKAAERWKVERIPDVVYGRADGKDLLLDIDRPRNPPPGKLPVILFFHGGAFRYGSRKSNVNIPLAARGYFTVNVEYRLSDEAKWPAQLEDAKAAVRWVRANVDKYHLDPDRVGVWGASAGAYLAVMLGVTGDVEKFEGKSGNPGFSSKVTCVADVFGPTDLVQLTEQPDMIEHLFGKSLLTDSKLAHAVNPATYATADAPPFLILHGDKDTLVPFAQSQLLANALNKAGTPVQLITLPGVGHDDGIRELPAVRDALFAFFDANLKK